MKPILILTDYSDSSLHAAAYAYLLAEKIEAPVKLLHVKEKNTQYSREDWLSNLSSGKSLVIEVAEENGNLAQCTKKVFEKIDAQLVVMGIKVKSALNKLFLGSGPLEVLHKSDVPLLIVPESAPLSIPERVMIAVNIFNTTKTQASSIAEMLCILQRESKITVDIVNVDKNTRDYDPAMRKTIETLHACFDKFTSAFHYIEHDNIVAALQNYAVQLNTSLIVAVRSQKGFVKKLVTPSVTEKLAWYTHLPLWVVHA